MQLADNHKMSYQKISFKGLQVSQYNGPPILPTKYSLILMVVLK